MLPARARGPGPNRLHAGTAGWLLVGYGPLCRAAGRFLTVVKLNLFNTHTLYTKQQAASSEDSDGGGGVGGECFTTSELALGMFCQCFFFWWGLRGVGVAGLRLPLSLYRRISFFGLPIKSYSSLRPLVLVCIKTHTLKAQCSKMLKAQRWVWLRVES